MIASAAVPVFLLALAPASCGGGGGSANDAPPERPPFDFADTDAGSAIFGSWVLDAFGLPAYRYDLDQHADPRASYPSDSRGRDRRDHFFNFGNDRVNAIGTNDGVVMLYGSERGPILYNRFAPEQGNYAGGFGTLDDGSAIWSTAYAYRPDGAETRRAFGIGYFETELAWRGIRSSRRVHAPSGDDPVLVSEVRLTNETDRQASLRHYEYWDVNLYPLTFLPVASGSFGALGDLWREGLNENFVQSISWNGGEALLRVTTRTASPPPKEPDEISVVDYYPADVFLADLGGGSAARYTNQAGFFGDGGPARPSAAADRAEGQIDGETPGKGQPLCLVLRHDLSLAPGESRTLRFAYGYARPGAGLGFLDRHRPAASFERSLARRRAELAYFDTGEDPEVARETAWHSFSLPAATAYLDYHQTHVTTQGSAYLYIQGMDGAPRDQALFSVPLVYLRPDLARENLRLIMGLRRATDGQILYSFGGNGFATGVFVHEWPSDLDIFFLMALSEYLAATGDTAFLAEEVPFRQPGGIAPGARGETVLDHARAAIEHLLVAVGTGEHGLIRVRDGDWSDGVVASNVIAAGNDGVNWRNTVNNGESCSNTGMALAVLPLAASILEPFDADLASRLRSAVPGLRAALDAQWTGSWYTRAILRDKENDPVVLGRTNLDLEAQPWAILSGTATGERLATLVGSIDSILDAPSPVGAPLWKAGEVWPAVSQLLTWAYARTRPDLAWRSITRHAFFSRAAVFPETWFGIWTGPDGLASTGEGGTWSSPVTPMTDFPALNQNQHAMALFALLRVAGIEPAADGLTLTPRVPRDSYVLDTPLLRLEVGRTSIDVEYRPIVSGTRIFHVEVPAGSGSWPAVVDGRAIDAAVSGGYASIPVVFRAGRPVRFSVPRG